MKCPLCQSREHVELDLHAEGFSQDARECGDCGAVWTFSGKIMKIIKDRTQEKEVLCSDFTCPTCKCTVSHEMALDSYQFHEELYECAICGTVCSIAHQQQEVVQDSQKGSFLDTSGELVEADDYNFM